MGNKVNTTSRIRVGVDTVYEPNSAKVTYKPRYIYTSSQVCTDFKELMIRAEQVFLPRKGMLHDLLCGLHDRAKVQPDHFMKSSVDFLMYGEW